MAGEPRQQDYKKKQKNCRIYAFFTLHNISSYQRCEPKRVQKYLKSSYNFVIKSKIVRYKILIRLKSH